MYNLEIINIGCSCNNPYCSLCRPYTITSPTNTNVGWTCPRCGRGNAPWKSTCDCVAQPFTVTWGTNTDQVYTHDGKGNWTLQDPPKNDDCCDNCTCQME